MSIRFERFLKRISRKSEFLPFKNRLLNSMKKDAKAKRKNYPKLINNMLEKWENEGYKKENDISHLLANNVPEFLTSYFSVIFPFRRKDIKYENIKTPSRLDFIFTTLYRYSKKELEVINEILNDKEFPKDPTTEKVCKFILLYCINSFAMPIEEVFERPFAFMPQKISTEQLDNDDGIIVSVSVQGREQ